ncbi:NAD(P)-binding domain-containing protein [Larkinella terrae]|uniref:SidA/IucD/PvdA family monooxygenase n=1 Tax=Larkinella terrae TaxID=2025311 RepID=A0A7K0ERG8_9BACT|nr:NAD(P)-binding domain-containing protein [Larkinella terrae]MRS64397.1 SidA/IucD/PvdA family monooxygenase [Larkinella terrae]
MNHDSETLIIGAGPFGLGLAAYLQNRQHDFRLVGYPMEFWKRHMPAGMLLRSGVEWHLDPDNQWTIERFLTERGESTEQLEPLPLELYLAYCEWFIRQTQLPIQETYVTQLSRNGAGFRATLADGSNLEARQVVVATGFYSYSHVPDSVSELIPVARLRHTRDANDLAAYRDKRVLIVGGRQSAFEWAALLREAGAARVDLSYRHDTPQFTVSDWSWVEALVTGMVDQPGWFRRLSSEEKEVQRLRLWTEGRLKLEPWLAERIFRPEVHLHPRTQVRAVSEKPGGLSVTLDSGEELAVDEVIAATGYQVDIRRLPFLSESLLTELEITNGFPVLDEGFQSNVTGLYFSSFPAGQAFGPFFGFTIGVRAASRILGAVLNGE